LVKIWVQNKKKRAFLENYLQGKATEQDHLFKKAGTGPNGKDFRETYHFYYENESIAKVTKKKREKKLGIPTGNEGTSGTQV